MGSERRGNGVELGEWDLIGGGTWSDWEGTRFDWEGTGSDWRGNGVELQVERGQIGWRMGLDSGGTGSDWMGRTGSD